MIKNCVNTKLVKKLRTQITRNLPAQSEINVNPILWRKSRNYQTISLREIKLKGYRSFISPLQVISMSTHTSRVLSKGRLAIASDRKKTVCNISSRRHCGSTNHSDSHQDMNIKNKKTRKKTWNLARAWLVTRTWLVRRINSFVSFTIMQRCIIYRQTRPSWQHRNGTQ